MIWRPSVRFQNTIALQCQQSSEPSMIKRFHVLYVGQIDLDRVGIDGTPANDRRYPNSRLSEVFFTTRHIAQVMDDLGYHALWTAEHHFQREGYECLPN